MSVIKSLTYRERSNVDDMGMILTAFITIIAIAWTLS